MGLNRQLICFVAATIVFGVTACHGPSTSSAGYLPSDVSSAAATQADGLGIAAPDRRIRHVESTCGKHLHIVLLGIVDCKFKEKNYGGTFRIFNKTKGIVTISPSSGTRDTTFTILGAVIGQGAFLVKDQKGHHLTLRVKVTL